MSTLFEPFFWFFFGLTTGFMAAFISALPIVLRSTGAVLLAFVLKGSTPGGLVNRFTSRGYFEIACLIKEE